MLYKLQWGLHPSSFNEGRLEPLGSATEHAPTLTNFSFKVTSTIFNFKSVRLGSSRFQGPRTGGSKLEFFQACECLFSEVNMTSSIICQTYSFNDILWRLSMCAYHMDLIVGSTYLCMHTIVTTYPVSIKQICSQMTFIVFLNRLCTAALLKLFHKYMEEHFLNHTN